MKSNRIFLYGYWRKNLGDDLMLEAFRNLHPDSEIHLITKKAYLASYRRQNLFPHAEDKLLVRLFSKIFRYFDKPSYYHFRYANQNTDFVALGGSLFIQDEKWRREFNIMNYMVTRCKTSSIVSSNFGPYQSEDFLATYIELFKKAKNIILRDKKSYDLFSSIESVKYAPDIVLTLEQSPIFKEKNEHEEYYVISNINVRNRSKLADFENDYESKLAEIAESMIEQGREVVFMSFCDYEGDLESIHRIRNRISEAKRIYAKIVSYDNLKVSLEVISNSNGIIATRFHAMILAFRFNIPVFPFIYSEKTENVIVDYGFPGKYSTIEMSNSVSVAEVLKSLGVEPKIPAEVFLLASKSHSKAI